MNKRIEKKKIILFVIMVLVIVLAVWRIWPHSLDKVLSTGTDSIISLEGAVTVNGFMDGVTPSIGQYKLSALSEEKEHIQAIMDILYETEYRKDFRNLLPWSPSLSSSENSSGSLDLVTLAWICEGNEPSSLQFIGDCIVIVRNYEDGKSRIYHPSDRDVCDKLVDYILKYGEQAVD